MHWYLGIYMFGQLLSQSKIQKFLGMKALLDSDRKQHNGSINSDTYGESSMSIESIACKWIYFIPWLTPLDPEGISFGSDCAVVTYLTPPKLWEPVAAATNSFLFACWKSDKYDQYFRNNLPSDIVTIRNDSVVFKYIFLLGNPIIIGGLNTSSTGEDVMTYARKRAPLLALAPFWRKTLHNDHQHPTDTKGNNRIDLKWLPPITLSRQVPTSALP